MDVQIKDMPGGVLVSIDSGGLVDHVSFMSPRVRATADALVPLAVVPGLLGGSDVVLSQPVSPRLWGEVDEVQALLADWYDRSPVTLTAPPPAVSTREQAAGEACFFSCGVDSFFSALELAPLLDALILVRGFDFGLGRAVEVNDAQVVRRATEAAAGLGLELVVVSTDLRRWSDRHVLWGDHYVGAGLAVVAHLLGGDFGRIHVPATHVDGDHFPYGTHPLTDPRWSSEVMEVVPHGGTTTRPEKVARIADSAVAMRSLRVCWENRGGAYNCGRCSKCVRTMIELWSVGALERCETMPDQVEPADLTALVANDPSSIAFVRQLKATLARRPGPEADAFDRALSAILP